MPEFNLTKRIIKPCGNNCIAVHLSESEEADPEFEACGELLYRYVETSYSIKDDDVEIEEILHERLNGSVTFSCKALQSFGEELPREDIEGYRMPVCICLNNIKEAKEQELCQNLT